MPTDMWQNSLRDYPSPRKWSKNSRQTECRKKPFEMPTSVPMPRKKHWHETLREDSVKRPEKKGVSDSTSPPSDRMLWEKLGRLKSQMEVARQGRERVERKQERPHTQPRAPRQPKQGLGSVGRVAMSTLPPSHRLRPKIGAAKVVRPHGRVAMSIQQRLDQWVERLLLGLNIKRGTTALASYKRLLLVSLIYSDNTAHMSTDAAVRMATAILKLPKSLDVLIDLSLAWMVFGTPKQLAKSKSKDRNYLKIKVGELSKLMDPDKDEGVYRSKHSVYVRAHPDDSAKVLGYVMHELTHAVANWLFENECRPYAADDESSRQSWQTMQQQVGSENSWRKARIQALFGFGDAEYQSRLLDDAELIAYSVQSQCPGAGAGLLNYDLVNAWGLRLFLRACSVRLQSKDSGATWLCDEPSQSPLMTLCLRQLSITRKMAVQPLRERLLSLMTLAGISLDRSRLVPMGGGGGRLRSARRVDSTGEGASVSHAPNVFVSKRRSGVKVEPAVVAEPVVLRGSMSP